jgi:hypothetical protein
MLFLSRSAKQLRKATISFVMSVRLFVRLSVRTRRIREEIGIGEFYSNLLAYYENQLFLLARLPC